MIINRLIVQNWRNFQHSDVQLSERQFIVGPHASGKSNLLDIFRFLREIATATGGFQNAVRARGGLSQLRCLSARRDAEIALEIHIAPNWAAPPTWRYALGFCQAPGEQSPPMLTYERIWQGQQLLVARPDADDENTPNWHRQTALEDNTTNTAFRELTHVLQSITELQVPSNLRHCPDVSQENAANEHLSSSMTNGLLARIASADEATRQTRLKTIEAGLIKTVPQFAQLAFVRDAATGQPHLQARYSHWPPQAGWQREDQFSTGTLRLIGLLWALLESDSVLLIEEPERSLNPEIVSQFAPIFWGMQARKEQQVLISTQSDVLLAEPGIDGTEVLMLTPTETGTEAKLASDIEDVRVLLKAGLTPGEVVFSGYAEQLSLLA